MDVEIVAINPGPVVTRFEIDPAPGVKVSRITNLAKDLARSWPLSASVLSSDPGKSTVGIEIPNQHREMVRLSQILVVMPSFKIHRSSHWHLVMIFLDSRCALIWQRCHLLVAGTTVQGSLGLTPCFLSMLYKARPDDLRLILVDPKMLDWRFMRGFRIC